MQEGINRRENGRNKSQLENNFRDNPGKRKRMRTRKEKRIETRKKGRKKEGTWASNEKYDEIARER